MKKGFVLPLAVPALIIIFSLCVAAATERHTQRWQDHLQQADALAQAEEWPEAAALLEKSYEDWSEHQLWLRILAKHDTVDSAETLYRRCLVLASARSGAEFRTELADLSSQLALLAQSEELSLGNVL